jgi:hypothetical protein
MVNNEPHIDFYLNFDFTKKLKQITHLFLFNK